MNRKEAIFELLRGSKVRRELWPSNYFLEMDSHGLTFRVANGNKMPFDINFEPFNDWEFAYPEVKATYKDAIKAFSEGKAIRDPDGKIHQIDAYAKENEGECYTIID